jgi:two-component system, OmpR family, alkaline phosphatase synthesis response regulator PhoP
MYKHKILVVDDEPHLLRSLTFVLSKEGYQVTMANDGEEALRKIVEDPPHLLFLDIMMPKINGYEVLETIRAIPEYRNIYVFILSAKGSDSDRTKALSLGADEFISKPFSPIEVVARVKDIIMPITLVKNVDAVPS